MAEPFFPTARSSPPAWFDDFQKLLDESLGALDKSTAVYAKLERAAARVKNANWRVLVSGLRSVGKSSFVCSLWGDSQMLPTAERDCTQTNTLIRLPSTGEQDRQLRLKYLPHELAVDFAVRGQAYYRLSGLLNETLGPMGPKLDEMSKEKRLATVVDETLKLFKAQPKLLVLHETLTDDVEELQEFLKFIQSEHFKSDQIVNAGWKDRRDNLMGRRREDGRPIDLGKLAALQHVEIVRDSERWPRDAAAPAPQLVDTPWVPAYHSARRADLIIAQAREADLLLILARAGPFELEDWVKHFYKERPGMAARSFVVFNQVDTVDTSVLFARDGFARTFEQNAERLALAGIKKHQLFVSCARLPFLQALPDDPATAQRIEKLRGVLARLRKLSDLQPNNEFKQRLLAACDEKDTGIESLRKQLMTMAANEIPAWRAMDVLEMLDTEEFAVPQLHEVVKRARGLSMQIKVASRSRTL
jgi:hypothetical protein